MSNPAVSVIIPTKDRSDLLKRAVRSVANQTYSDYELIIINDGSSDDTRHIRTHFPDLSIVEIEHPVSLGASAARNAGIRHAKGEYIAFLDDDDVWEPKKLEVQMNMFRSADPRCGVVYTAFWRIQGSIRTYVPSPKIRRRQGDVFQTLLAGNFIGLPTVIVKKEILSRVGLFDENLPRLQDWELFLRLSHSCHFFYIDEPLMISYHQENSITTNQEALIEAVEYILSLNDDLFRRNKKCYMKQKNFLVGRYVRRKDFSRIFKCWRDILALYGWNMPQLIIDMVWIIAQGCIRGRKEVI